MRLTTDRFIENLTREMKVPEQLIKIWGRWALLTASLPPSLIIDHIFTPRRRQERGKPPPHIRVELRAEMI